MGKKISIDEEIENLKACLNTLEIIHPDYISPELKEIQGYVLATHARLEKGMENLILSQIKEKLRRIDKDKWYAVLRIINPLFDYMSYRNKTEAIKNYSGVTKNLIRALDKVNKYRIEFAHPKGFELRNKYNYNSKGKQNIRDILRCLKNAEDEMNNYFKKLLPKRSKN